MAKDPALPKVPDADRAAASDSPLRLFVGDIAVLLAQIPYIIDAFLPLRTKDHLAELYPTPKNIRNSIILLVVSVLETVVLFALFPAFFLFPGLAFAVGIFVVFLILYLLCLPLQGKRVVFAAQNPADWQKFSKERWVFVNGIMTSHYGLQRNCERLAETFGRPIVGVHNRSYGIIHDLIECLFQRCFYLNTTDGRITFAYLRDYVLDPSVEKVVLIGHSQGGLIVSLVLDKMFTTLDSENLSKLEVYTFGSAASHFDNPRSSASRPQTRIIRHIEHFCNEKDPVTRWGVLYNAHKTKYDFEYHGRVFFRRNASGHLFTQHYNDVWFPYQDGSNGTNGLTPNGNDNGVDVESPEGDEERQNLSNARQISRLSEYVGGREPDSA
ncbi:hypothetical protein L228DRAFT_139030 [Xylona heveae TC161]|uniref:DUF676 domain-containing protein n=1 Tax=Xylona heveae (strain CBS 132557 / TC161) TaxID=1328760 RepID=A0A165H2G5_XYLHT|nr:hypothetical protein L228DRAFT_139030 [Xylona heveae TC161]KZF22895.1 hypothetical protein L228DRAFT_139030 [Xylona heveae TC161]